MTKVSSSSSGVVMDFYSKCNNGFHVDLLTNGCLPCTRDQSCWKDCQKIFESAKEARLACMAQEDIRSRWEIGGVLGAFIGLPLLSLFISNMASPAPQKNFSYSSGAGKSVTDLEGVKKQKKA